MRNCHSLQELEWHDDKMYCIKKNVLYYHGWDPEIEKLTLSKKINDI